MRLPLGDGHVPADEVQDVALLVFQMLAEGVAQPAHQAGPSLQRLAALIGRVPSAITDRGAARRAAHCVTWPRHPLRAVASLPLP